MRERVKYHVILRKSMNGDKDLSIFFHDCNERKSLSDQSLMDFCGLLLHRPDNGATISASKEWYFLKLIYHMLYL